MSDEKPKSTKVQTCGTRRGNGRGHGGPAKPNRIIPSIQNHAPFEAGNKETDKRLWHPTENGVPSYRAVAKAERLELLRESLWNDAFSSKLTQRDRHAARESLINREEGMPVARVVQTDDADKWFVEGVREARTVDEWTQEARLETAKPAGNAD